jgi:hypothetical protein
VSKGWGGNFSFLLRGLSSFEARALALLLLLILVLPTMSEASEDDAVNVSILSENAPVRGETAAFTALVTGSASNVTLRWVLPEGFELINGSAEEFCPELECERNITVSVSNSSALGPQTIGVELEYE